MIVFYTPEVTEQRLLIRGVQVCASWLHHEGWLPDEHAKFLADLGVEPTWEAVHARHLEELARYDALTGVPDTLWSTR